MPERECSACGQPARAAAPFVVPTKKSRPLLLSRSALYITRNLHRGGADAAGWDAPDAALVANIRAIGNISRGKRMMFGRGLPAASRLGTGQEGSASLPFGRRAISVFMRHQSRAAYSSSVTGSSHSVEAFSPGTPRERWLNHEFFRAPCQCFTPGCMFTTSPGLRARAGFPSS